MVAWASLRSGYALPPQRPSYHGGPINRQKLYLSKPKRCLDEASHLFLIGIKTQYPRQYHRPSSLSDLARRGWTL